MLIIDLLLLILFKTKVTISCPKSRLRVFVSSTLPPQSALPALNRRRQMKSQSQSDTLHSQFLQESMRSSPNFFKKVKCSSSVFECKNRVLKKAKGGSIL
ncbi:hypothetical protein HS088_TW16G00722 [Tripterygium wilfordii]|uniref:Uncharacterized protein n=1 Tax=Tripterygium wilfordii TaxID=458696 RepID=A0A7J7CJP0_TRIWF|nr:hypothetical protein HS088_TW16G00722 [Tripterygium wilfordii]